MIKIDTAKLDQAIASAFKSTAEAYAEQCQIELRSAKWEWTDRLTKRRNGDLVGSPRDRVDTEELVDSQQPVVVRGNIATIEYTAAHAPIVYNGYVDAQDVYPGTPWGDTALEAIDLPQIFRDKLKANLR